MALAANIALAAVAGFGPRAPAQTLESTVADSIDDQIQQQVEDELADSLEQEVEQQVEQQVEAGVEAAVEQQVEQGVEAVVEQQVEQGVQRQIESGVEAAVERRIEDGVVATVEQQVQDGVADAVEQAVESGIVESVEGEVVSGAVEAVQRELESGAVDSVRGQVENGLDALPGGAVEGLEDPGAAARELPGVVLDAAGQIAEGAGSEDESPQAPDPGASSESAETYIADIGDGGRAVERDVWVVLVPSEHAARIQDWGFDVRERQDLASLERVMLRITAPEDRDIVEAALDLAVDAPGTLVDFNHAYRLEADGDEAIEAPAAAIADEPTPYSTHGASLTAGASLAVGMIDSQVEAGHESLAEADIVQRDFVPYADPRPTAHGTAVASILVGRSAARPGVLRGARLHAASVFFDDGQGGVAATTAGLVTALEWLAAEGVDVINMSLTGPPNRVLEGAIDAVAARGGVVVAAVGNNGPHGEPLYPAAYVSVVGVTAVDEANEVYYYASRGPHVMFAAPGVNVKVARSGGGYGVETGTSMAAPHAAGAIAQSFAIHASAPAARVLELLKRSALDLGEKDVDEIFGFGLISSPGVRSTAPP